MFGILKRQLCKLQQMTVFFNSDKFLLRPLYIQNLFFNNEDILILWTVDSIQVTFLNKTLL